MSSSSSPSPSKQCYHCLGEDHVFEQCPVSPEKGWQKVDDQYYQQQQQQQNLFIPDGRGLAYHFAMSPRNMVITCTRCMSPTHQTADCYSRVCENSDCPRPIGHTTDRCFKCDRCGRRGHLVTTCRLPVCGNSECGLVGHTTERCYKLLTRLTRHHPKSADAAATAPAPAPDDNVARCTFCKKTGHHRTECRRRIAQRPPCTECNDNDHGVFDCPYLRRTHVRNEKHRIHSIHSILKNDQHLSSSNNNNNSTGSTGSTNETTATATAAARC
jgi:hypothetical protein